MNAPITYESLFTKYRDDSAVLRNEQYAFWSIPTIYADPDLVLNGRQQAVRRDFQSVGAMLANHLASKIASLLFPSTQSFFRLDAAVNTAAMADAMAMDVKELASGLAELENTAYRRIFLRSSYHQLVHTMKLLICTGNCLLYRDSENTNMHAYSLRQYSLLRDGSGKVLDIVLKERTTVGQLPEAVQAAFYAGRDKYDAVCLYTRVRREPRTVTDVFVVTQQVDSYALDVHEEYAEAVCPYIPVTWNLVTGENYGRGLVEDYAGDFAKLSELSEALALYEIEACRVLHMAAPGSQADIDSMADQESGAWVAGDPTKVEAYEAGDYNKILALTADLEQIFQRLAPAFMYGGNVRDAERVTAEEIRTQAEEANQSLGGVYSVIADNLHIPLAHILCAEVNPEFVSEIIAGGLTLSVLTGVAALGRSADVNKLLQVAQVLATVIPVFTQSSQRLDPERVISKVFEGFGLNLEDYTHTEEELQAKQQMNAAPAVDAGLAEVANTIQGVS